MAVSQHPWYHGHRVCTSQGSTVTNSVYISYFTISLQNMHLLKNWKLFRQDVIEYNLNDIIPMEKTWMFAETMNDMDSHAVNHFHSNGTPGWNIAQKMCSIYFLQFNFHYEGKQISNYCWKTSLKFLHIQEVIDIGKPIMSGVQK